MFESVVSYESIFCSSAGFDIASSDYSCHDCSATHTLKCPCPDDCIHLNPDRCLVYSAKRFGISLTTLYIFGLYCDLFKDARTWEWET